jgi:hypothetical protein
MGRWVDGWMDGCMHALMDVLPDAWISEAWKEGRKMDGKLK